MKGAVDRKKVVLRHLPPNLSQSMLLQHLDSRFTARYNWFSFRPAKSCQKHQGYSRAYIDFKSSEDVIEFAEFFDGHVFVNEKGTQFKAIVEYAPSQRVPKSWSKKDGREGTILKDPDYLEFLEFLAKPVENLPSAEIQLERKEAERAGSAKNAPIVTPLMDYIRQKRAANSGSRRSISNGKSIRRLGGISSGSPSASGSKRGSEKRRTTTMYVLRDSSKAGNAKNKAYVVVPKPDGQELSEKFVTSTSASGIDAVGDKAGGPGAADGRKKKILLLKGKEKEVPNVSSGPFVQQNVTSTPKNTISSSAPKQNQRHEPSGRIIRSILLKDARQNQSSNATQSEELIQDKDKRPPRPPSMHVFQKDTNGSNEDKVVGNDLHVVHIEKQEKRSRNRDRPDRGVWAPLRRAGSPHAGGDLLPSSTSQSAKAQDFFEGSGEMRKEIPRARNEEFRAVGSGWNTHASSDENGTYKHGGRRGIRDDDGTSVVEGKPLRRGGSSVYVPHEKQVWVQKSSSGS